MAITLNGEEYALEVPVTIRELIRRLNLQEDAVAVERNRIIVSRSDWASTSLYAGDRVEVVHFVGGG